MISSPKVLQPIIAFLLLNMSQACFAGYFGASEGSNTSISFDKQERGLRVDFGSDATPWLDLEWSYIDYGYSSYNDPTFTLGDPEDDDDFDRYEHFKYGSQYVTEEDAEFSGIGSIRVRGISAGLKFKKDLATWLDVYARVSLMAWESQHTQLNIYSPRNPYDSDGNQIMDPVNLSNADNLNPCGTLDFCRIEDTENPVHTWAVDFWYGYGAIFKPFSWLALRAEYSIITLNAINFPQAKLETVSAGLEIHY